MAIPLPESFGEYSKSIFTFPIILWIYITYFLKNILFLIPLFVYVCLFLFYIFWFEKRVLREIEPEKKTYELITVILVISLNPFYLGTLLISILTLNVLNDYIAFFLVIFAFLGYVFWSIKAFVFSKPHIKEIYGIGINIGEISHNIVKEKPNGKLDLNYLKKSIGENIDKLKTQLDKKKK